jgi:hypothetical protein
MRAFVRRSNRSARVAAQGIVVVALAACAARMTQFDQYLAREQWTEAAREFASDSSLHGNEHAVYRAALLYGTPGRPTYSADTARVLLTGFLKRFPASTYHEDAVARLALLDQLVNSQRAAEAHLRELEARIDALTRETRDLRARADSATAQRDSLRATIVRLEGERRDREEQLKALRLELQQLKEIDLKSRPTPRPIKPQ